MMKKLLALILVISVAMSLVACGKSDNGKGKTEEPKETTESKGTDQSKDADVSDAAPAIDTSEHVVINYMTTGDKPTNGKTEAMLEKLNAILTEKVNAELNIYWIEWTDYMTNYNLTLAQNDGTVDLVGTATDWLDAWPNIKKGAFLPLSEDMLKTYAPKTWESVPQEHWDVCKYEGQIYLMPEDNYAQWTNHGFIFRNDFAKQAGLTNGIHSWEEMETYFQWVKDNVPDITPWDPCASGGSVHNSASGGWISSHTDDVFIEGLEAPIFYGDSASNPYKVVSAYYEGQEFVEYAKLMKKWADAGYWSTDVLNKAGDGGDVFRSGLSSVWQHHTQSFFTNATEIKKAVPEAELGFFFFGDETDNLVRTSITHGAMAISAASKNPERALMVYDLLRNDEECYRLFNYGIEGEQYIIDENGMLTKPDGYDSAAMDIQTNFWWGRNDNLELKNVKYAWDLYEPLAQEYDKIAINYPYGQIVLNTDNIKSELSNLSNVVSTYLPRIAFGKMDDPEAFVAEFREQLKAAGMDTVIAELQAQMDAFTASQN